jgi:GntR family transcriptional regulator
MDVVFHLDLRDPLPLYAQLERSIKLAIAAGKLHVGNRLPTVRQLAVDLKVNANTVAKVYAELERQGVVSTRRGMGTFVERAQAQPATSRGERAEKLRMLAERFLAEAAGQGFTPDELLQQIQRHHRLFKEKPHDK